MMNGCSDRGAICSSLLLGVFVEMEFGRFKRVSRMECRSGLCYGLWVGREGESCDYQ